MKHEKNMNSCILKKLLTMQPFIFLKSLRICPQFMMSDRQIIELCARHDRKAQQVLYDKYSRLLLGVCLRYANDKAEAEDILQDSFLKIFFSIKDFTGSGSFVGWLRKVSGKYCNNSLS